MLGVLGCFGSTNRMFTMIQTVCAALDLDPLAHGLQLLDAAALIPERADWPAAETADDGAWSEMQGVGPYMPAAQPYPLLATRPALLFRLETVALHKLAASLTLRYGKAHLVALVSVSETQAERAWQGLLSELAAQSVTTPSFLYLAPLDPLNDLWSADGPTTVMMRLLGPKGCPWDREQTHRSLRKDLLGEAHEVLEAIDQGDADALAEELGDLLLQVLIHSEIARQAGEFTLGDVYHHLASKLIRRHPHVFVDGAWGLGFGTSPRDEQISLPKNSSSPKPQAPSPTSGEVLRNWDAIKQAERASKGQKPRGTLDGIPVTLPALALARETIRKAVKAGFDTDDTRWAWQKLREEVAEVAAVAEKNDEPLNQVRLEEEFGDMLLAAAKLAQKLELDAESALREAVGKFRRHFSHVETLVQERGLDLKTMPSAQKEALWHEAKQH